jgi:hypothetical protein
VRGLALRLGIETDGTLTNPGILSAKVAVTDADGRASASYTAPPTPPSFTRTSVPIRITVTPIGTDANGTQPRSVTINLIPTGTR